MHEEPKTINDVINAGANGYLFKNSNKTTILTAVLHVAKGGFYLSNEVTQKLENNKESVSKTKSFIPSLSGREKEILQLVSKGLTTDQIADKLCISHHTVLSHRKNLLLKFDVNNTASLVKKAIDANLID
jgi:DNA-binding NarL/FixJ family response regulator